MSILCLEKRTPSSLSDSRIRILLKLLESVGTNCKKAMGRIMVTAVLFYRFSFGAVLGGACRFQPSCSQYALDALRLHSFGGALQLISTRLLKCRPGGPFGLDPVPSKGQT